jgi:hypothetical protein
MSDSNFDRAFGGASGTRTFADRVGRGADSASDSPGASEYRAYGHLATGDICETCDVQRWLDGTDTPEGIEFQYRFLMQIGYMGEEEIKLYLPDCIIVIEGKSLRDLRKKLARRQVTLIQQFSSFAWASAPRPGIALINAIQILRPAGR